MVPSIFPGPDIKKIWRLACVVPCGLLLRLLWHNTQSETRFCSGVNLAVRKLASLAKPNVVMEISGDNVIYKSISTARTTEVKCKIGEEFEEAQPDGVKTKVSDGFTL